jgi:hypothetical protein
MIALSERLRKQSRKFSNHEVIADLRLATRYLREFAALKIADEVEAETDPERKAQLEREFIQVYSEFLTYTRRSAGHWGPRGGEQAQRKPI